MLSGLFSRTKKKEKTILLVDIGSGSVGAALGRLRSEGKPTLLYATRTQIPVRLSRSGSELTEDILKAAALSVEDVRKKAALWNEGNKIVPQHIEQVAFFLAAPWSSTSVKSVNFSRTKPFVVGESLLERMLSEEAKTLRDALSESTEVIERTALLLKLNGYPVESIVDTKATTAEVTLATTLAYTELCDSLEKIVENIPGDPVCSFHSFAIPATFTLRTLYPDLSDALILDVRSEVTEAILMQDGAPLARATAPAGVGVLLRTLKSHAQMEKAEADTALALAAKEGTRLSADLSAALLDATNVLLKKLSESLQGMAGSGLPQTLFVFSDERSLPWITRGLTEVGLPAVYPANGPKIVALTSKELLIAAETIGASPDIFLFSELIYADSRFDEGRTLSLLSTRDTLSAKQRATLTT